MHRMPQTNKVKHAWWSPCKTRILPSFCVSMHPSTYPACNWRLFGLEKSFVILSDAATGPALDQAPANYTILYFLLHAGHSFIIAACKVEKLLNFTGRVRKYTYKWKRWAAEMVPPDKVAGKMLDRVVAVRMPDMEEVKQRSMGETSRGGLWCGQQDGNIFNYITVHLS
jgi:hypothetical protein